MTVCSSTNSLTKPRSIASKVTPMPMFWTFTKIYCLNTPWWCDTFTNSLGNQTPNFVHSAKSRGLRRKRSLASVNAALTTMSCMLIGSKILEKEVRQCNVAVKLAYWLPSTRKDKPKRRQATWTLNLESSWSPLKASTSLQKCQAIGKTLS